ncbi:isopeptide-forming domain-containing fimbrial protein [uncultured Holdemanella sp.]|uniref:isopeptide-forming domain-containing fimbrial protein n=1 Tax=uncultured Holdemanella sp. TaxID=1763549 RepID=UPI00258F4932|nr:isopeptide-forming domain-containing fimbrial protein [uncultured Holdemanella sp.]
MKLIKKIAAIMFAFMMVVSMSCNVKADDTTATTETGEGKITINNAIPGQTYKIYKILELESYDSTTGNYAYKVTPEWKNFVDGDGNAYLKRVDGTDYVNWVGDATNKGAHVKEFAKNAIAYVKKANSPVITYKEKKAPDASAGKTTSTVTFDSLPLGYYLVDSSAGSLCGLDTTAKEVTIEEKNGVPSVDKKVSNTQNGTYGTSNNASIGDTVYFQTTITAQPGAQNYVLHDKMTKGLTLKNDSIVVKKGESPVATSDYTLKTSGFIDGCTFEIVFVQTFCDGLQKDEKITVTYSATLNANAVIGNDANTNTNKTLLSYGDSQKTTEVTTNTKTFKMDVFKYTENRNDKTKKDGLADAVFTLKKDGETNTINFVKEKTDEINGDIYRVANTGDASIKTNKSGKFTIKGLSAGIYYLTETKQPAGYNKLKNPVTVVIDNDGNVKVDDANADPVEVENKSGTVLPSTGGAGTTMIYLIGGALVLGSGVVLATKRRVKNK